MSCLIVLAEATVSSSGWAKKKRYVIIGPIMPNFSKYRILIFSENPDTLMPFYRDVLGLKLIDQLNIPGDYGYMFLVAGDLNLWLDRKSTRLNSSHSQISYAVFCLKKKKKTKNHNHNTKQKKNSKLTQKN